MILEPIDPKKYETFSEHTVCGYHKRNPGKSYAGCTCFGVWGLRKRSSK